MKSKTYALLLFILSPLVTLLYASSLHLGALNENLGQVGQKVALRDGEITRSQEDDFTGHLVGFGVEYNSIRADHEYLYSETYYATAMATTAHDLGFLSNKPWLSGVWLSTSAQLGVAGDRKPKVTDKFLGLSIEISVNDPLVYSFHFDVSRRFHFDLDSKDFFIAPKVGVNFKRIEGMAVSYPLFLWTVKMPSVDVTSVSGLVGLDMGYRVESDSELVFSIGRKIPLFNKIESMSDIPVEDVVISEKINFFSLKYQKSFSSLDRLL